MSKKLFEPVSPGASSPCHSDNCLDDDEEKSRVVEPSLCEIAEIFLDTSATIEISQSTQNSNWCLWIMICGLHDESILKGLLALVEKHVPNVQYEGCKKVVYKGQVSFVLHFKEHFTAQKVFTFLKEDFYAKTFIKDRWQVMRIYNRMDDPKYMSQFFAIILQNLPLDCTSQTIIDLVAMHSSNISVLSVEIPTLIGDSFCSLIRTKTLEDAEMLALTLNGLITQTGNIRAGLHPQCNFKHQNFDKDPFKDLKVVAGAADNHSHKTGKESKNDENKTDIKSLLSLFKNELKTKKITAGDNNKEGMPFEHHHHQQQQFPPNFFGPRPGPSFGYHGPSSAPQTQQFFPPNNPRNLPPFPYGQNPHPYRPQSWGPPPDFRDFRPAGEFYHPPTEFPRAQRFGKKIQKTWIKPTRSLNNKNNPRKKPDETKEISQFTSLQLVLPQEEAKKEVLASPSLLNPKRSFVDSVQSGNKQNLEKVFERKLADWNIGIYQVKGEKIETPSEIPKEKIPIRINRETFNLSSWKITCGTNSNSKSNTSNNSSKLPIYLENMMDQMINPSSKSTNQQQQHPKKPSRFSDTATINEKRRFESLYPEDSNKIQKLKTNIQEFQKKSNEIEDHNGRFKKSQNSHDSCSDEEAELNLGPQKKQYLETFTTEIPNYGEVLKPQEKAEEKKINLDSLGWSIKCNPPALQKEKKDLNSAAVDGNSKKGIPTTTPAASTTGATNIVFNGPYVQSSNLNCIHLPPGMAYPHLLMNMNHQQQPPLTPNSFSFNPQMMVYHNNFILNSLVHQPSFWNIPVSNAPPQQESALQTNSPKKLKDWTPKTRENLIPAKTKANEECPEPESTPPILPPQETQGGIEHCD